MSSTLSLAEIEARARGGDARAQYLLSALYSRKGDTKRAKEWLQRSYEAGYPDALYSMATGDLKGVDGEPDVPRAIERLNLAISKGSQAARRVLATLSATGIGGSEDWSKALALLLEAARAADGNALRQLGLLVEIASPRSDISLKLLSLAARAGDGLAAFALIRRRPALPYLTGKECGQWIEALKRGGHPLAHRLASSAPAAENERPAHADGNVDWVAVSQTLSRPPLGVVPEARQLSTRPAVWTIDGLLNSEECEYVIGAAAPLVRPSTIYEPLTGAAVPSTRRTSGTATISPAESDLVLYCLGRRIAAVAKLPPKNAEMLSVLRYYPGEEYKPHVDYIADTAETTEDLAANGQRIKTVLVYLNNEYNGGETFFLSAGLKVKGRPGDAALFANVDEAGRPDGTTVHAGLPVTQGVKWLASAWFREREVGLVGPQRKAIP